MPNLSSSEEFRAIRGAWLNPVSDERCDYYQDGLLIASKELGAWKVVELGSAESLIEKHQLEPSQIERESGLLMPPFFDMHFHWVQDEVRDMPKASLLEWLEKYTFPKEAAFADEDFAEEKAAFFWKRILATGTIGGLCYSSIHQTALEAAMRHAPEHFRVGNVLMTMNSPEALTQSDREAMELNSWASRTFGQRHVTSPRFAPTTGPDVISAASFAADGIGGFAQTHMCETQQEIDWVLSIYRDMPGFEDIDSYIQVYERTGFLGPKTVLGHCIHLSDAEWQLMAETDTVVASCPTSNGPLEERGLGSGLFDYRRADQEGVRWALASDIGGGPYLSMLDVMASFVRQNRAVGNESANFNRALFRSTQMGATILGLGESKGSFSAGKDLDYISVEASEEQLALGDADTVLAGVILPYETQRDVYDSLVRKTVIAGESVFSC